MIEVRKRSATGGRMSLEEGARRVGQGLMDLQRGLVNWGGKVEVE